LRSFAGDPGCGILERVDPFPFRKEDGSPLVAAHRGASDRALENSLEAFALAAAGGVDMIELDVRLSSDGEPFVIHDARTGRTARENVAVADCDAGRLSRVLLKNGEPVPRLHEVLALVKGTVPLDVEVKVAGGAAAVCRVLAETGYAGPVLLYSGLREECLAARSTRPDLPCGLVTGRPSTSDVAFCLRHGLPSIHPSFRRLTVLRAGRVKRAGLALVPYTVDDEESFFRLLALGADGVFSNRAADLRKAWEARRPS
jgi:glycerophosphoryl diester phosphodiesterase